MTGSRRTTTFVRAASAALALGAPFAAAPALAQIQEPGNHPSYTVELEPHFVFQWENTVYADTALGVGARASIPVIDNGPITTINNNFAIGFGFDWAHESSTCYRAVVAGLVTFAGVDCSANHFWFPIVAQWNFFFTKVVSAYAELGLDIHHRAYNIDCNGVNLTVLGTRFCGSDSDTNVRPMFAMGARFHVADAFAINLRLALPYLTLGGSFFL